MYDATPLQTIAHGIVPLATIAGPIAAPNVEGVSLVSRTITGSTFIQLDEGLPGGGAVAPTDIRCIVCPFTNPIPGPVAFDVIPVAGPEGVTGIFVHMWNATTGLGIDNSYMFIVMRTAQSEST